MRRAWPWPLRTDRLSPVEGAPDLGSLLYWLCPIRCREVVSLDKMAVVDAARGLVDREGLDRLSVSALARQLGVRPPSLYHHVDGQDGLLRELALVGVEQILGELRSATVGLSGGDAIRSLCDAHRRYALAHPGLYQATLRAPAGDDEHLRAANRELRDLIATIFTRSGVALQDARHATRSLRAAVHGFIALEQAGGFEAGLDREESFRRLVERIAAVPGKEER
jgi:AcrR family transcriptional regulator